MELPQIRMQSQMAKIYMVSQPARQAIRQPKADLSIQQPHAEISMRTIPAKLTIDQTQAWEEMNLLSVERLNEKYAQDGKQAVLEGIGRRSSQGTELMKIENKGKPLISQSFQNAYEPMRELGIKFVPSPFSVKTHYQPSNVEIDIQPKKPIIHAQSNKPEVTYVPGSVDISMAQYQSLEIDFINLFPEEK
ncbi:DUF6470 family protein [Ornithinibacillus bavariensis]|uniref:YviE n=1 Tax=Ornithinibacillus bavariensis TaxID=545502 RepID=A0A919X6H5_9BACI|nr:DUF6470 family protein [Ornithinibacillus bavariensis]GIO26431.1 hypothetical protein J43TS3_10420 [Ornithinibacillus bavariensis]